MTETSPKRRIEAALDRIEAAAAARAREARKNAVLRAEVAAALAALDALIGERG